MIYSLILYNTKSAKVILDINRSDLIKMNGVKIAGIYSALRSYLRICGFPWQIVIKLAGGIIIESFLIYYPKHVSLIAIYDKIEKETVDKVVKDIILGFLEFLEKFKKVSDTNLTNITYLESKINQILKKEEEKNI